MIINARIVTKNLELVKAMHTVITLMNNEEACDMMLDVLDDHPEAEDYFEIAQNNESMDELCRTFTEIIKDFGHDGWYTGSKAYGYFDEEGEDNED